MKKFAFCFIFALVLILTGCGNENNAIEPLSQNDALENITSDKISVPVREYFNIDTSEENITEPPTTTEEQTELPTTTEEPTTPEPTTPEPTTEQPTQAPTERPTPSPTQPATPAPTAAPTQPATPAPTAAPTQPPTEAPTPEPTIAVIRLSGGIHKNENMAVVTPLSDIDKFSVFWGHTGNRVHISPECSSFGNGVLFGTLNDARNAERLEWCGTCSRRYRGNSGYEGDDEFLRDGNPNIRG